MQVEATLTVAYLSISVRLFCSVKPIIKSHGSSLAVQLRRNVFSQVIWPEVSWWNAATAWVTHSLMLDTQCFQIQGTRQRHVKLWNHALTAIINQSQTNSSGLFLAIFYIVGHWQKCRRRHRSASLSVWVGVSLGFRRCVGVMPRLDESTVISLISAVPDVNDWAIAVPSITVAPELPVTAIARAASVLAY